MKSISLYNKMIPTENTITYFAIYVSKMIKEIKKMLTNKQTDGTIKVDHTFEKNYRIITYLQISIQVLFSESLIYCY